MLKPALVIGLGGTGVLTLQHLKALLLHSLNIQDEKLPKHIKLVALDTIKDARKSVQADDEITKIAALRTELEPGEYSWIGGDVYDFVREIDKGEHPHISSWFQARSYLKVLPRASFSLEQGAGQLRQFGRLAVFHDVSAPNKSPIYTLFTRTIDEIRKTGNFETLDVFLVASVAGGTGAGMFVDIAYLARQIAKVNHKLSVRLRGFLVLPEAFGAIPGGVKPSMRARSFAAMRENKRFMVDFQYEHGYPMYYHATGQGGVWRSRIKTKLFDFLYHIDGRSTRNPLAHTLPALGVTAGIADVIAAMLDKDVKEGEGVYERHATNVVAQSTQSDVHEGSDKTVSFDSTVGSYTLILPMKQIVQVLSYRLTRRSLETLFPPAKFDEDGYPVSLDPAASSEFGHARGRDAGAKFLGVANVQAWKNSDVKISGTPFFREVLRVAQGYRPKDDSMVKELSTREAGDWQAHLDPPDNTPEMVKLRNRVQQQLERRLEDDVPPNQRGESAEAALDRIVRDVETFKSTNLGRTDMRTGQRVGGRYRNALEEYAAYQLQRFQAMIQVETENILNGGMNPSSPASEQKEGKLGYLIDWFDGLEERLARFLEAMTIAKAVREERKDKQDAEDAAQDARQELEEKPGGLFGGRRRKALIDAEQELIDVERVIIAEDVVMGLVQRMLAHTQALQQSAIDWAKTLILGYDSLYGQLKRNEDAIIAEIEAENEIPVREYYWDTQYLDDLYDKYALEKDVNGDTGIDRYVKRVIWHHLQQRRGVQDVFGYELLFMLSENPDENRLGVTNQERNMRLLLSPAQDVFGKVWEQESILKYLMTRKYPSGAALGQHLADKTDVWLRFKGKSVVPANYLHVAYGATSEEKAYLDTVRNTMAAITKATGKLNDDVNSGDRFTFRIVFTQDLIPLDEVASYKESENDYWHSGGEIGEDSDVRGKLGRETLHLFPAEVNAAKLETRIPKRLKIKPRALHNDVVLQLENMKDFRLFVRAWAFDVIRQNSIEVDDSGGYENYWALYQTTEEDWLGKQEVYELYLTKPVPGEEPDIVEAMKTWNYERKGLNPDEMLTIQYDRVRNDVKTARDALVSNAIDTGAGVDVDLVQEQLGALPERERNRFVTMWLEKKYLEKRQKDLEKDIRSKSKNRIQQDAAIAMFMVLDDDINSLDMNMQDMLRRARR